MSLGPPDLPASLEFFTTTCTITTPEFGTLSSSGMPTRTVGSNEANVPCRLDVASGAEAERYAHMVDETAYRLICPIRKEDGSDLRLKKDQYITIGGVKYMTLGAGKPEGLSGRQTVILKQEDR